MTNKRPLKPSDFLMAQDIHDRQHCYRATFATLTGRAGQPMAWDGDFDDHFTAEDYDRRRWERDARRYGSNY
jgi:hypothetical protein